MNYAEANSYLESPKSQKSLLKSCLSLNPKEEKGV